MNNMAEHTDLYRTITADVLGLMFDVECTPKGEIVETKQFCSHKNLLICIAFTGSINGEYLLCLDEKTAAVAVDLIDQSATDAEVKQVRELFSGALAEALNTVVGKSIVELSKEFKSLTFVSPRITFGKCIYPQIPVSMGVLNTPAGEIECCFFLDFMHLAITSKLEKEIEARKLAEQKLTYRLKLMEQLAHAGELLTRLNTPNLPLFLEILGRAVHADCCNLVLFAGDTHNTQRVYEWKSKEAKSISDHLESVDISTYPWLSETLKNNVLLSCDTIETLPEFAVEEKSLFAAMGIQSILMTSIQCEKNNSIGLFSLCTTTQARTWSDDEQELLRIVRELLSKDLIRRCAVERLEHDAFHDHLTNLPNRLLFVDRLKHDLELEKNSRTIGCGIVFMDIDRFKTINDSMGHLCGDILLRALAKRISDSVNPADTVARFSSDEFVILIDSINSVMQAVNVCKKIKDALKRPFLIENREIIVTSTFGISTSLENKGRSAEELLHEADTAVHRAKAKGGGEIELFFESMHSSALLKMEIENALHKALERDEFILHYQPIFCLVTKKVVGAEALIRWQHPERGMVPPFDFIPIAEDSGLILPIGEWVLDTACQQISAWAADNDNPISIAVNVAARQFQHQDIIQLVDKMLLQHNVPAKLLKIEITETALMGDIKQTISVLDELHKLGAQISLDDFGTGYSSLAYLKNFPVDILKIDKSFIDGITQQQTDSAMVAAIITLAHNLGMDVIAEGVETEEQMIQLCALGCDYIQGYFISRPIPAEEFAPQLAQNFNQ